MTTIPEDLIRDHILPFTYSPQSSHLCDDIRSYHKTMLSITNIYNTGFTRDPIEWLSNDICRFLNNDKPTMYGYVEFYITVFQRIYMYNNLDLDIVRKKVTLMEDTDSLFPRDIKIVVGLLQPTERNELKQFLLKICPSGIIAPGAA